MSCSWNAREDNTGCDHHVMDDMRAILLHGLTQTAVTDEVSSGLVGTRSVPVRAVSRSVVRCVLCSSRPYHNQRVVRLKQHKEKLDWNNTSLATLLSGHK